MVLNDGLRLVLGVYIGISREVSSDLLRSPNIIQTNPNSSNAPQNIQDLTNSKDYFIYKAALSFKTVKNVRFSTWLGNYIRYKCLDFLNETGYCLSFESNESQVYVNVVSTNKFEEKASLLDKREFVFDALSQMKDKRVFSVYKLRYFTHYPKMSWKKIGEHIGVSTQTAINLHEKGKKVVRGKIYK